MAMNVKIILTGRGLSMLRSLLRGLYVSAAAVIALSLQGCSLVNGCTPENLPRYVATLTIVNESSHTVAISDWNWWSDQSYTVPGTLSLKPGESSERFAGQQYSPVPEMKMERVTVVYDDMLEMCYRLSEMSLYEHSLVHPGAYDNTVVTLESGEDMYMYTFTFTDEDYETAVRLSGEQ